jgi:hypothetical protein
MAFTHLLWNCLAEGATSIEEEKLSANLEKRSDECVLVFEIDNPDFRKHFQAMDEKVCDGLFFYKKAALPGHDKTVPVVMFVELKGSDIDYAIEQLANTHRLVHKKLTGRAVEYRAIVVSRQAPPAQDKSARKRWEKSINCRLHFARGPKAELRRYLPE